MRRLLITGILALLLLVAGIAVLAKPETAVATLIVVEGQTTVIQNRSRLGVWPSVSTVTFSAGSVTTISQGDVISQDSGVGQLRLYDGSTVDLSAGTELAMTELIITPTEYRVQLQLIVGQIVNRVVKLLGNDDYFRVSTPSSTAAVRGTLFTVEVLSQTTTLISVDEGIVRVNLGVDMVDVQAGQMVTAVVGQPLQVQPQSISSPPAEGTALEQQTIPSATRPVNPQLTAPTGTPILSVATQVAPTPYIATPTRAVATAAASPTLVILATISPTALPTATPTGLPTTILPTTPATPAITATSIPTALPTNTQPPTATATIAPTTTPVPTATSQPLPTATATPTPEPPTATPEWITLCHVSPGNPNQNQTIQVLPDAVNGHLAHGDYLGPCQ